MTSGIILDADDIKKLIAEKFGVDEKDVIKTQYSYIIKKDADCLKKDTITEHQLGDIPPSQSP